MRPYRENRYSQVLGNAVRQNISYAFLHSAIFFGLLIDIDKWGQTFWTHSEIPLESLNFVALMKPNKPEMRSEHFSTAGPDLFWNTFTTVWEFSVFCKVFSQIVFRNVIVPLPKSQTRHPART